MVLLLLGEETRVHGVVRQEKEEEDRVTDVDGSGDEVEILPSSQRSALGNPSDEPGEKSIEDRRKVGKDDLRLVSSQPL